MSNETLIKSQDTTNRGDVESVLNKGDASGTNNPDQHFDIHKNAKKYYDIEKAPSSMPEVHKWQREHIKVHDQSKDGFPLNIIIDPAMREMYQHVHAQGLTNVFDRFEQQEKIRCSFCSSGLSCQLCANGPCRISPKAPRGNCGVDADVMVSRNFVYRHVTIGTSANIFHAQQAARTLKAAAEKPDSGLKIRDKQKLLKYAEMAGLNSHEDTNKVAINFANWVLADMGKPYWEESAMVQAFAPPKRQELWRKLGIYPGGGFSEIGLAQTKCMTNLNADPVDFLLTSVRLGIINEYQGLFALDILQEILMGTQKIRAAKQNMGLLKQDMVNIITNGHMPLTAHIVIELASTPEWQEKAKKAGASGMQILGHVCEGQQLLNYKDTGEMSAYGGQEGEWLSEEYLFATGAVDLFMFDYNCTIPTLPLYAERFGTKMVSTHEVIRMPGTEVVEFKPEEMKKQAEKILEMAIESYAKRKAENREVYIPPHISEGCVIGFSTESVKEALGGTWKPLIDAIAAGKIRGIATIVGCTTARYGQGGSNIFRIAKGLIEKDILVLSGGCTSAVMQYSGLTNPQAAEECGPGLKEICKALGIPPVLSYGACVDIGKMTQTAKELADALDVDTNKLPLVIGAPEYLEQKAVADACTAIALGWLVHVAPVPSVTGSDLVVKTLTETTETLGLGKLTVETNADKTVQIYIDHIEKKRKELGLH
ncbi:anaerobic carbon-monoxide dehydrogenase catalytic subunit [Sporomusa sp. KB1]|jgi:carbon-monoxide dehydrogenase catalytic subunit|uniref:anaerobic carbon-monoxide dehydrogenase catalytic subunit n=1 Tax=Sporomusa sp. KB1 TaxID=943346 RepID=UPI0011A219FB|nr:anaerobic carbon-monoxide dehydrogenase catalytic subunit [Sporomusa sp. KB1]TWH51696.1 carbon-monoxide dehydrogenase catalytic subunit [Sporomusa sp. KB1]